MIIRQLSGSLAAFAALLLATLPRIRHRFRAAAA